MVVGRRVSVMGMFKRVSVNYVSQIFYHVLCLVSRHSCISKINNLERARFAESCSRAAARRPAAAVHRPFIGRSSGRSSIVRVR